LARATWILPWSGGLQLKGLAGFGWENHSFYITLPTFTNIFNNDLRFLSFSGGGGLSSVFWKKARKWTSHLALCLWDGCGMRVLPNFFGYLFLTSLLSFIAPMALLAGIGMGLFLLGCLPGLDLLAQTLASQIQLFLIVFGDGHVLQGILTISLTCAFVGAKFYLFNCYWYGNLTFPQRR